MQNCSREKRLWNLAEQDEIYLFWKTTLETCEKPFKEYAETCPEEIQRILYGYADSGRMMCQRVINIACKHMEFADQNKK